MDNENKETMTENAENTEATETKESTKKKGFLPWLNESRLETVVAIFLGITALLTAWATWIGSLHGGNQATNYAKSNNLSADGNSMWNEASQQYMQDMLTWNDIVDTLTDIEIAEKEDNRVEANLLQTKLDNLIYDSGSEEFIEAVEWALDQPEYVTPFDKEGYVDHYYEEAQAVLDESSEVLAQGQEDNANGDRFGLVTVIFSLVLFLLGIVGIFKNLPNRKLVFIISLVFLIAATIYMFTIPLPSGFTL
ncbi:MAG: DUF4064 domain-containing protein [Lachnospiraceae bacterium]|nr:DUF4064 domain-containing protein [Lachnospiraceae bacterium]